MSLQRYKFTEMRSTGLQKLKLALALPVIQFAVAVLLLRSVGPPDYYWSEAALICFGLNAPAWILWAMAVPGLVPTEIFGFGSSDLFFLAGVIIVWYLVGRALDQRRFSRTAARPGTATTVIVHCFLLALGGFLVYAGFHDLATLDRRSGRAVLTLAWAVSLLFISGKRLVTVIRLSRQK